MSEITNFLSSLFGISSNMLVFPDIVFLVIIPFLLMWYGFYLFLCNGVKIFRNSNVNIFFSLVLALLSAFRFGIVGVVLGAMMISYFKSDSWIWRIIYLVLIVGGYVFLQGYVTRL